MTSVTSIGDTLHVKLLSSAVSCSVSAPRRGAVVDEAYGGRLEDAAAAAAAQPIVAPCLYQVGHH